MRLAFALVTLAACLDGAAVPVARARAEPHRPTRERVGTAPGPDTIRGPLPRAELSLAPADAQSKAAARLVKLLARLRDDVRVTRYQARTSVRAADGEYAWDCSGMAAWIMRRTAPRALAAVGGSRPVARDFHDAIARAPAARARRGWQRVAHVRDARPGDVFAWRRSPLSTSKVTGHVGFIVGTPAPVPGWPNAYAVRIVDATRLPHQDDTRSDDGIGGFGFGTMVFVTDEAGTVEAYGWFGTDSLGLMPAQVVFGRPTG